ncbi:MAG: hypothetical protein ABSA44_12695 [Bacteroidota bacterium]|jgi:hypothetical protein
MVELTKSQKKKVRELIEKGITRDFLDGVKRIKSISDSFVEGSSDPKEYYHKLFSTMMNKNEVIAKRYDDLRGSNYFIRLVMLLEDGVISREEIQGLDDELKAKLSFLSKNA